MKAGACLLAVKRQPSNNSFIMQRPLHWGGLCYFLAMKNYRQGSIASKLLGILIALVTIGSIGGAYHVSKLSPSRSAELPPTSSAQPAHVLWGKLRALAQWPEWQPGIRAIMPLQQNAEGIWSWRQIHVRNEYRGKLTKAIPPDSLSWELLSENGSERYRCDWTFEAQPKDSTLVNLRCEMTVGPVLKRFQLHHGHDLEKFMQEQMTALLKTK